ncbi:glycosyltransferase [Allobacillus sp. SKP2-8]|uniref:glycosyltransferase n=1 Tax=unclassified Allobacillus TaxID=2628859 RepID=UPI001183BB66|nr:glycosyltransferase [Allobacillus sp. SKP2-8]TSJ62547.1 glycosyltransferase [Allobacillus sp. SKP2-8]
MRFSCCVTLFYPTEDELDCITNYRENFERVYIFDNTEGVDCKRNKDYFANKVGFTYLSNQQNDGLSVAFNIMCQRAVTDGFDYICIFDQDSFITSSDLSKMKSFIEKSPSNKVGIYVPYIMYSHLNEDKAILKGGVDSIEVDWAISSGSFINLSVFNETEGFDENYFIDRLDYDYCYTIRDLGYKVVRINNVFLHQNLGEERKVLFRNVSQHNVIRHYYIFRNRLYFYIKKDKVSLYSLIKLCSISIKHLLQILLSEEQKKRKIKMIIISCKDFINGKMGKYNEH